MQRRFSITSLKLLARKPKKPGLYSNKRSLDSTYYPNKEESQPNESTGWTPNKLFAFFILLSIG